MYIPQVPKSNGSIEPKMCLHFFTSYAVFFNETISLQDHVFNVDDRAWDTLNRHWHSLCPPQYCFYLSLITSTSCLVAADRSPLHLGHTPMPWWKSTGSNDHHHQSTAAANVGRGIPTSPSGCISIYSCHHSSAPALLPIAAK